MSGSVFHVSEDRSIALFEPRVPANGGVSVVWAIDGARLRNYLLPRDCPRVTCYAGGQSSAADIERFLGRNRAVVAIEHGWYERVRVCQLYAYHLPATSFECMDECAGYFISHSPVEPTCVEIFADLIDEQLRRGVELRVLPELWTLHDAVAASTLQFSMIRMRNAIGSK